MNQKLQPNLFSTADGLKAYAVQKSSIQAADPELSFWHKALDMVRYLVPAGDLWI